MTTVTLVLPYPVSANRYWQSFVPRGATRAIVHLSTEAKAYKKQVAQLALAAGLKPLFGRVRMTIRLFPSRPKDWARRSRKDPDHWEDGILCLDLGNVEKVISDSLNGIAWADDKQLWRIELLRSESDDLGARVEVTIEPLQRTLVAPALFGEAAA